LTCFLEYFREYVSVTDILYEKKENRWDQKISSYRKLRISVEQMKSLLLRKNFRIEAVEKGRMNILIGAKTE
ncbi:MAG TPA: class I SAM-dependent methyltransferase, partial [Leptospiraceae bacterium]|nr:class I SAM-dependent methyltransferase [Leptospiraceae bacterium]